MKRNLSSIRIIPSLMLAFLATFTSCSNSDELINDKTEQETIKIKNDRNLHKSLSNVGTYTHYPIENIYKNNVVQAQIDITVESMGDMSNKLFFPSMQVDFGPANNGEYDGAHLGVQHKSDNSKVSNWGGYFTEFTTNNFRYTPFFNNGPNVTNEYSISNPVLYNPESGVDVYVGHFDPGTYTQANEKNSSYFNWQPKQWYRYKVYRDGQINGYYKWRGSIEDLQNGKNYDIGTVYSKAPYINNFLVWVETSFSDNTLFDVRFVYPKYKLSNGSVYVPKQESIIANVSNNPNNSVIVPDKDRWDNAQAVWHRNGIDVPVNAYKYKTISTSKW